MGLGKFPAVSLQNVPIKAQEAREMVSTASNPIAESASLCRIMRVKLRSRALLMSSFRKSNLNFRALCIPSSEPETVFPIIR